MSLDAQGDKEIAKNQITSKTQHDQTKEVPSGQGGEKKSANYRGRHGISKSDVRRKETNIPPHCRGEWLHAVIPKSFSNSLRDLRGEVKEVRCFHILLTHLSLAKGEKIMSLIFLMI